MNWKDGAKFKIVKLVEKGIKTKLRKLQKRKKKAGER
jgi:predicted DNA-binding antitoxin AbrB/MazE fold protein